MPSAIANPNNHPETYPRGWFRFLEILPGACVWIALFAPFVLSIYYPLSVAIFIIAFDVYWLQKSLISAYLLFNGHRRYQRNIRTNWMAMLKATDDLPAGGDLHALPWRDIYNAIIVATYKEEEAILRASIASIARSDYPHDHLILVLATEERDKDNARQIAANLQKEFGHEFYKFIVTEHPDGMVGEVKGKGANATWAAKELVRQVEAEGITYSNVIVSTADADTRFHPQYFACLSYVYATTPDRLHCSYQPISTFLNNIWEAPMLSRVMAFSTTFWHLAESIRDYRLLTFSTHAMSLQTLVDINYWCTSIVNEDSRQYFRAFFHYSGHFRSQPLFMPVYMDAVHVKSFRGTLKNLYLQQQRWAYGVEHFPYIVLESLRHTEISPVSRIMLIWRAFNGSFSWGTNAFFITVVGWLPAILNNSFRDQVIASNMPLVTKTLLEITWIGVIIATSISFRLLPPPPKNLRLRFPLLMMALQWVLVPISTTIFGALPGLDSQTRLMFGKYLGFRVTEKKAVT